MSTSFQFFDSNSVMCDGYTYRINKRKPNVLYFKCSYDDRCTGYAVLRNNERFEVTKEHYHPPNEDVVRKRNFIVKLVNRVREDHFTPIPQIYKDFVASHEATHELSSLPTFESVRKRLYRARSSARAVALEISPDINVDGQWSSTADDDDCPSVDDSKEGERITGDIVDVECAPSPLPDLQIQPTHLSSQTPNQQLSVVLSQDPPSPLHRHPEKSPCTRKRDIERDDIIEAAFRKMVKPEDEFDALGTVVAFKLRRMDAGQRDIAELLLNQVLLYGLRRKLDDNSYVCVSTHSSKHGAPATTMGAGRTITANNLPCVGRIKCEVISNE